MKNSDLRIVTRREPNKSGSLPVNMSVTHLPSGIFVTGNGASEHAVRIELVAKVGRLVVQDNIIRRNSQYRFQAN